MDLSPPLPNRVAAAGRAAIRFVADGAVTRLAGLEQRQPLRVLLPRADGVPEAVLINISGGLVGGDRTEIDIAIGAGAAATVTTQAAEKVYRSAGPVCHVTTDLAVGAGGRLAWLPQETILFDRCRLRRALRIDLAAGATLLAGEMLVLGRSAHGERLSEVDFRDAWTLRVDGRIAWADRLRLASAKPLGMPFAFAGGLATGLLVYAAADAREKLDEARALLDGEGCRAGVTALDGVLVARWLSPDISAVRRAYGATLSGFRAAFLGVPGPLPRVWAC